MKQRRMFSGVAAAVLCGMAAGAWGADQIRPDEPEKSEAAAPATTLWEKFQSPDVRGVFADFSDAWPERVGFEWGVGPQGVVVDVPVLNGRNAAELNERNAGRYERLVTAWRAATGKKPGEWRIVTEGPNSLVPGDLGVQDGKRGESIAFAFEYASVREREGAVGGADGVGVGVIERTGFEFSEPAAGVAVRGLVLLMPGMFGTPEGVLRPLNNELRKAGFAVLRMKAQPSRFTEEVTFRIEPSAEMPVEAKRVAMEFTNRVGECGLSSAAAIDEVYKRRPELAKVPMIAIGFSAGAMTLPSVVARTPDRFAGAVMVGGGCDFWRMVQASNYSKWIDAVRVEWPKDEKGFEQKPDGDVKRNFDDLVLLYSPLDSYHTVKALQNKPVLFVHGENDLAVPSPLGDVLFERCKGVGGVQPERWSKPVGHELLFMGLRQDFPRLLEWVGKVADGASMRNAKPESNPSEVVPIPASGR